MFLICLFPCLISGQALPWLDELTKRKYSPCVAWTDIIAPRAAERTRPPSTQRRKPILHSTMSGEAARTGFWPQGWCLLRVCVSVFISRCEEALKYSKCLSHVRIHGPYSLWRCLRYVVYKPVFRNVSVLCQPRPQNSL